MAFSWNLIFFFNSPRPRPRSRSFFLEDPDNSRLFFIIIKESNYYVFKDILIGNKENQLATFSNESITYKKLSTFKPKTNTLFSWFISSSLFAPTFTSIEIRNKRRIILGEHRVEVQISEPNFLTPELYRFIGWSVELPKVSYQTCGAIWWSVELMRVSYEICRTIWKIIGLWMVSCETMQGSGSNIQNHTFCPKPF